LDDYVQEFNLLQGLASKVAIIDKEALLRYFVQGLHLNIWIGLAAALPDNPSGTNSNTNHQSLHYGKKGQSPRTKARVNGHHEWSEHWTLQLVQLFRAF
jgi:hypothetical protein